MTFLQAAVAILKESSRPMTAKELAGAALSRGLMSTRGKTPEATLTAGLYRQVKRQPGGPLFRVADPGPSRARRGSVRWEWRG
jgi:restriction system protein